MPQITTPDEELGITKTAITIPSQVWDRAKVQAARKKQSLNEFSASAVEFYVDHLEEEYRQQILSTAKSNRKASS